MQFLMGLNESFDSVRSQILLLDSSPYVNKVYSMVFIIEKQRGGGGRGGGGGY